MLKARLEQLDRHLRPTFPNAHVGTVNFDEDLDISNELLALVAGNTHAAYYLPWDENTGFYVDPASPPYRKQSGIVSDGQPDRLLCRHTELRRVYPRSSLQPLYHG